MNFLSNIIKFNSKPLKFNFNPINSISTKQIVIFRVPRSVTSKELIQHFKNGGFQVFRSLVRPRYKDQFKNICVIEVPTSQVDKILNTYNDTPLKLNQLKLEIAKNDLIELYKNPSPLQFNKPTPKDESDENISNVRKEFTLNPNYKPFVPKLHRQHGVLFNN